MATKTASARKGNIKSGLDFSEDQNQHPGSFNDEEDEHDHNNDHSDPNVILLSALEFQEEDSQESLNLRSKDIQYDETPTQKSAQRNRGPP